MYLSVEYHDDSMVLVTSRSLDILCKLQIQGCDCFEMPNLKEEGAVDLFLYYIGSSREFINGEEWKIVHRCVKECCFLKK